MKIKSIEIKNIRGLEDFHVDLNMIPNKPSLLVAPNGSGKSSFAIAFQSLKRDKISVTPENLYLNDATRLPELAIKTDEQTFKATNATNEINSEFGIFVINSRTKAETNKRRIGEQTIYQSKMAIDPIVLVNKVPEKIQLTNDFSEKNEIKTKNGLVPSINKYIANTNFIFNFPIEKLSNIQNAIKITNAVIKALKEYNGSTKTVLGSKQELAEAFLPILEKNKAINSIREYIKLFNQESLGITDFLAAIQLIWLFNNDKSNFKKAIKHAEYILQKKAYTELFKSLKKTWQNIIPKESNNKLFIEIPDTAKLSNGERDIIVFLAMLEKAKLALTKGKNILIIDEVFDYLDDANLISAQYYITQFIDNLKNRGKNIFPIILTHLNPDFYYNYAFSDMKTYYLRPIPHPKKSILMQKLLFQRTHLPIDNDPISKYLLHYHNESPDNLGDVLPIELKEAHWDEIDKFVRFCNKNMNHYLNNEEYCPLSVCVLLRRWIELYCFKQLKSNEEYEMFFTTKTTARKILKINELGYHAPEIFSLLSVIYNTPLHTPNSEHLKQILYSRLENNTIRAMINTIKKLCS